MTPAIRLAAAALVVVAAGCSAAPGVTDSTTTSLATAAPPSTVTQPTQTTTTITTVAERAYPEVVPGEMGAWVPEVVARLPHDPEAFTQGLLVEGDVVWESTGLYGRSTLRRTDRQSGEVLGSAPLEPDLFAEGLEMVGDRLVQLTWREETALVWDPATMEQVGSFGYQGEGWGLCALDDVGLVMSDGTSTLTIRHQATFEVVDEVEVTRDGAPVANLNELECVDGLVFANVWQSDEIVVVDPDGSVVASIHAAALDDELADVPGRDVLNGIAYDPATGTFLLSGKWWPTTFEVRFVER